MERVCKVVFDKARMMEMIFGMGSRRNCGSVRMKNVRYGCQRRYQMVGKGVKVYSNVVCV